MCIPLGLRIARSDRRDDCHRFPTTIQGASSHPPERRILFAVDAELFILGHGEQRIEILQHGDPVHLAASMASVRMERGAGGSSGRSFISLVGCSLTIPSTTSHVPKLRSAVMAPLV